MQLAEKIKKLAATDFAFYLTFILIGFLLFINGLESFISSSEFWSIYLSQKVFTVDPQWTSVYLKPLFHSLLSTIYWLDLNDFYHIVTVKMLFAVNGILQFVLIFKILNEASRKRFINLLLTAFLFTAPFFLSHMNQVRSDQLALTFFLLLIYLSQKDFPKKKWLQLGLATLFPAIAFKHIYFTLLALCLLPLKTYFQIWQKQSFVRRLIVVLLLANLLIWSLYQAASALHYFLDSYDSPLSDWNLLVPWVKTEWFFIYFSFLPFALRDFRNFIQVRSMQFVFPMQVLIIFIFLFHPQKLAFFIASFLPLMYLASAFFCQYLVEKKIVSLKIILPILFCAGSYSLYTAKKYYHVFTLNNPQLIAIERISNIITKNHMTYLDGMGVLPRGKNIGCLVSPEDPLANNYCLDALRKKIPDAIIVTNRLLGLGFDFFELESMGYKYIGPNVYVRSELANKTTSETINWPAPTIIFSFEQMY